MARKEIVLMTDDLEPEFEADETVTFSLDGATYEIDLSEANAVALRETLAPYVAQARKAAGTGRGRTSRGGRSAEPVATGPDPKAVRAWAAANNEPVSSRGRIPADLVAKFQAAGN
jgi:hypothetical protein